MEVSQIYILVSIAVLFVIAVFLFFVRKRKEREGERMFTPLVVLAFAFILAGLIFGDMENRLVSYSFIGAGVLLAMLDIIQKIKKIKKEKQGDGKKIKKKK